MPISHTNCYGKTYYLHEGKTKIGNPKYFVSTKSEGNFAKAIPDGYEIYEQPGGMVYFRKIQKTPILPHELKYVQDKIAPLRNKDDEKEYEQMKAFLIANSTDFLSSNGQSYLEQNYRMRYEAEIRGMEIIIYRVRGHAMPILKFELIDEETREYLAYRWCFRGRIDGWIHIGFSGQLKCLVDKYCPSLGTDDFYELI